MSACQGFIKKYTQRTVVFLHQSVVAFIQSQGIAHPVLAKWIPTFTRQGFELVTTIFTLKTHYPRTKKGNAFFYLEYATK